MTQKSQSNQRFEEEDVPDEIVNEAVKALLVLDFSKKPIKQAEILSLLLVKPKKKQMVGFWKAVQNELAAIDVVLCELPDAHSKSFILIANTEEPKFLTKYHSSEEKADRTLIIIILAYIFMKDGVVMEEEMLRHLTNLHIITKNSFLHKYFGDVKKKLTGQFVDQLYISRKLVEGQDDFELSWGERSKLEVSESSILDFVCKVGYNNAFKPQDWVSHYAKINPVN